LNSLKLIFILCFNSILIAQTPYPDSVISVEYGPGAGFGQQYFPANILGYPSVDASPAAPANLESDLLSLGSGGSITLHFVDNEVYNGPGPDFSVFENVFYVGGDSSRPFRETALVEVSSDGLHWQLFPFDSVTGSGLAGIKPTNGSADPSNPQVSGGDQFDLDSLDLPPHIIRFIRLTDTDTLFQDDGPGFDLDAVVGIHSRNIMNIREQNREFAPARLIISNYPNPFNSRTTVRIQSPAQTQIVIKVFDLNGRLVRTSENRMIKRGENRVSVALPSTLTSGTYFIRVLTNSGMSLGTHKIIYLP